MNFNVLTNLILSVFLKLRLYLGTGVGYGTVTDFTDTPFVAIWNAPSYVCQKDFKVFLNLTKYGIRHNQNESFHGEEIVLFYEPAPGLYPKYLENGSALNGGLPQNVNYDQHLQKVKTDIVNYIPNPDFRGLSVIDWESWRPIFVRNLYNAPKEIYINKSEDIVRQQHPKWNESQVKTEAQLEFEFAARQLMHKTLQQTKDIRNKGGWGYYGFPRCYNYREGQGHCANDTIQYNNRLSWLFNASSALFPSIYLNRGPFPTVHDRLLRVQGILRESLRVRGLFSNVTPIYAYTMYHYKDTGPYYEMSDLENTIGQSFDAGVNGVVLWDSSENFKNAENCQSLSHYLEKSLGPFIQNITIFSVQCQQKWCSNHGRCVKTSWSGAVNSDINTRKREFSQYKCVCYQNYTGQHCNRSLFWTNFMERFLRYVS